MKRIARWLIDDWQWPYAAAFAATFLTVLAPILVYAAGWAITLVYLQLPLYMFHQLEEHAGDRFRNFVNSTIGKGKEVLSPAATFVINSAGVWGVDLAALYLAVFVNPGWGLMAMYLPVLNAVGHIAQGILLKRYNPGLWTSLLLFLPVSGASLILVSRWTGATLPMHLTGLAVAILVHVLIMVHVKRELARS
jgi:hypothetical protein